MKKKWELSFGASQKCPSGCWNQTLQSIPDHPRQSKICQNYRFNNFSGCFIAQEFWSNVERPIALSVPVTPVPQKFAILPINRGCNVLARCILSPPTSSFTGAISFCFARPAIFYARRSIVENRRLRHAAVPRISVYPELIVVGSPRALPTVVTVSSSLHLSQQVLWIRRWTASLFGLFMKAISKFFFFFFLINFFPLLRPLFFVSLSSANVRNWELHRRQERKRARHPL